MPTDTESTTAAEDARAFIEHWKDSGASERGNAQQFLGGLCDLLGVPRPQPSTDRPDKNTYCFERSVKLVGGSTKFMDLYKKDCFVLEAKQGSDAPDETEAEALTGETLKRKMGTAAAARAAGSAPCRPPRSRPAATPAPSPPKTAGRPSS